MAGPKFLCDEHVPLAVCRGLSRSGLDAEHVIDLGLRSIPDPALLREARDRGCILLTRNYHDFASLASNWAREGVAFPGVLFFARSIGANDVGAHVRALTAWLDGPGDVADTYGWLG